MIVLQHDSPPNFLKNIKRADNGRLILEDSRVLLSDITASNPLKSGYT